MRKILIISILTIVGLISVLHINSVEAKKKEAAIALEAEMKAIENAKKVEALMAKIEADKEMERIEKERIEKERYDKYLSELASINAIEDKQEWFLAYKNILFEYSEWYDTPETIWDVYAEDEVMLICRMVETECYGQSFMPKVNVASVVFNRLKDDRFGNTITEVITQKNQFVYFRKEISPDTINAVMYAFEIEDPTNGSLFFHSNEKKDRFSGANYVFTDEAGHHFYRPEED